MNGSLDTGSIPVGSTKIKEGTHRGVLFYFDEPRLNPLALRSKLDTLPKQVTALCSHLVQGANTGAHTKQSRGELAHLRRAQVYSP